MNTSNYAEHRSNFHINIYSLESTVRYYSNIYNSEEECWLGPWVNNVTYNENLVIFVKSLDHIIVELRAGKNMVKKVYETGALKKEIVKI